MSPHHRPRTITELAAIALADLKDESIFKQHLRKAEKEWKEGKRLADHGDLENAYIALVKAAKIILEKMPMHPDYQRELSRQHQDNLAENGRQILSKLEAIKPVLMERQLAWAADQANHQRPSPGYEQSHTSGPSHRPNPAGPSRTRPTSERPRVEDITTRMQDLRTGHPRDAPQRHHSTRKDSPGGGRVAVEATLAAARQAASTTADSRTPTHSATPSPTDQPWGGRDERDKAWRQENDRATREVRQEELERRLKEADEKAAYIRQTIAANNPGVSLNYSTPISPAPSIPPTQYSPSPPHLPPNTSAFQYPTTPLSTHATPMNSRLSHLIDPMEPNIRPMPLQRPSQFSDDTSSTDSESVTEWSGPVAKPKGSIEYTQVPTFPNVSIYSSPLAQSHVPSSGKVSYPQIMSQHQKSQGYRPDFQYPQIPTSQVPPHEYQTNFTYRVPSIRYPAYPGPSRAAPPLPPPAPQAKHQHQHQHPPPTRPPPERQLEKELPPGALRRVNLPKAIISRFLQLARANTTLNMETCGLLLGKPKGLTKFVVTTLLVPKQHSTSDTCTMDEEELVIGFTEERELVTLGWIHTHPSQSCFMSSVDLHTHSGFQMMLRESFAVVCAPRSEPNFGIFRLTDPPGLQIIKDCKAKEAFHPHPDLPIYTDADKGHVRMKELPLEIIDLR